MNLPDTSKMLEVKGGSTCFCCGNGGHYKRECPSKVGTRIVACIGPQVKAQMAPILQVIVDGKEGVAH